MVQESLPFHGISALFCGDPTLLAAGNARLFSFRASKKGTVSCESMWLLNATTFCACIKVAEFLSE